MQTQPVVSPPPTSQDAAAPLADASPRRVYKGTGVFWALIAALVAAIALVVLIAQNTSRVVVRFLWFKPEVSLVVLVLAGALLAVCIAEALGLVWRRRRRERLTNRDELHRLRDAAQ